MPPMEYKSRAPWMQLSWDIGPVTLSGGLRREDGELHVNDYTTTWYRDRRHVGGGTLDYQENLTNFGAVWRVNEQWSVFGSYGEGFTLANVGIPLRNVQCSGDGGSIQTTAARTTRRSASATCSTSTPSWSRTPSSASTGAASAAR
ncbi:hypothetical protein CATMIT_01979 [Catenibacterium mitsuokai DSM 15897]|nr:hypothetical protein CATMIT_01979 [Catenibacterium mitsuokai DSM 15897]